MSTRICREYKTFTAVRLHLMSIVWSKKLVQLPRIKPKLIQIQEDIAQYIFGNNLDR